MTQIDVAMLILILGGVCAFTYITTDYGPAGALAIILVIISGYLAHTAPPQTSTTTITITIPVQEDTP